jgi:3-hydroxyacyl-CoA dehydrogenase
MAMQNTSRRQPVPAVSWRRSASCLCRCAARQAFLVNAALAPYMLEAMRYVDQGVSPAG